MTPALLLLASLALQDAPAAAAAVPSAEAAGAPTDDYGYVAWCRGALTGHMELMSSAGPEIARVRAQKARTLLAGKSGAEAERIRASLAKDAAREEELDREQRKAGEEYLTLYKSAMDAAENAGAVHATGEKFSGEGYRIWSAARASDPKTQMYSYLMWELPGRCETAANALKRKSGLLGAAFRRSEAAPPADAPSDASAVGAAPPEAPAAEPTEPAPPPPALRPTAPADGPGA